MLTIQTYKSIHQQRLSLKINFVHVPGVQGGADGVFGPNILSQSFFCFLFRVLLIEVGIRTGRGQLNRFKGAGKLT